MAKQQYTTDLFISYASEDMDLAVGDISMALYEIGVTSMWMDKLAIKPSQSIPNRIDEGLQKSRYILPIITVNFFKKGWTQLELNAVRMLSKPIIPIWVDVNAKSVAKFSPLLAATKAIIYDADPYDLAKQIASLLIDDKRTHFYKNKHQREGSIAFWGLVYLYILLVIQGQDPDNYDGFTLLNNIRDKETPTAQENVREALDISHEGILERANIFRIHAKSIDTTLDDEEIAHLICGEVKRRQPWFPYEEREYEALHKIGLQHFT